MSEFLFKNKFSNADWWDLVRRSLTTRPAALNSLTGYAGDPDGQHTASTWHASADSIRGRQQRHRSNVVTGSADL